MRLELPTPAEVRDRFDAKGHAELAATREPDLLAAVPYGAGCSKLSSRIRMQGLPLDCRIVDWEQWQAGSVTRVRP